MLVKAPATRAVTYTMKSPSALILLLVFTCLLAFSIPLRNSHFRRLPHLQISWATSSSSPENVVEHDAITATASSQVSNQQQTAPVPFFWMPSPPLPSSLSVSISTTIEIVSETVTTTVYEEPKIVTITAAPITVTNTVTVPEPFTATPGSSWSAPARFSNLDSFKIAHFAGGERNLEITTGVPPDEFDDDFLRANTLGADDNMKNLQDQIGTWNSSSTLQLLYPEGSINPGNSPQGGADFYATPIPLGDASNVTLTYSVFFPKDFDWVLGGKLPGLYGGHMTCSGGDDATECFSTRLMWRANGAGELYLYAPKDKQSYALCHAPPQSVCNSTYGLSVGRGSFKFTPGEWTHVRQTVALNTPGKHNGGFRLEVNGKVIMNRHDVFYRDVPSRTVVSPSVTQTTGSGDDDADNGGLIPSLIGGILGGIGKADANQDVSSSFTMTSDSSSFSASLHHTYSNPPLLPFHQQGLTMTNDAAPAFTYDPSASHSRIVATTFSQPTFTQIVPHPTVTVTNYLWEHAFDVSGKEAKIPAVGDGEPKPVGFSGLFFSTFFGGSSEEYATPRDQYTWFKGFAININS